MPMRLLQVDTNDLCEDMTRGGVKRIKYLDELGSVDGKSSRSALDGERYKESDSNECGEHLLC